MLEPEIFEDVNASPLESPIVIPESKVQYLPDSAKFSNPEAAAEVIQPVADFLLDHPDCSLLLYGTCAGDSNSEYTLWLGKARALSVRNMLVAAGVDESRITVLSVKVADDPYYQFGLGTGVEASVNRKTVLVCAESPFGQQIISNTQ